MTECGLEAEADLRASIAAVEEDAVQDTLAQGREVIELTDAEREEWKAAAQPVIDAYLENSGELGQKVLDALEK